MYAMAKTGMLPSFISKIHPKYNTPYIAVLITGAVTCIAPFFGIAMLTWVSNTASTAVISVYFIVSLSFIMLRKKKPDANRPYKVKNAGLIGSVAIILTLGLLVLCIPGMPSGLKKPELILLGVWCLFGVILSLFAPKGIDKKAAEEIGSFENI